MEILNGERRITAPMALRFAKAFGTDPRYWTNLQSLYETKTAQAEIGEAHSGFWGDEPDTKCRRRRPVGSVVVGPRPNLRAPAS